MKSNKWISQVKKKQLFFSWTYQIVMFTLICCFSCQAPSKDKLIDFLMPEGGKSFYEVDLRAKAPAGNGNFIQTNQHVSFRKWGSTLLVSIESVIGEVKGSTETIEAKINDESLVLITRSFKGLSKKSESVNADLILFPTKGGIETWKYHKYDEVHFCNSRIVDTIIGNGQKQVLVVEETISVESGFGKVTFIERSYYAKGEGLFAIENFAAESPKEYIIWTKNSENLVKKVPEYESSKTLILFEKGTTDKIINLTLNPKDKHHFKVYVEDNKYFYTEIVNCDQYEDSYLLVLSPVNFQGEDGECGFIETLTQRRGYYEFYLRNETNTRKGLKFKVHIGSSSEYYAEHPQ